MIRLSSQTQKTQMASAASYGVGMPTSDGGLGAVSRSLKTVASSSAQIGNVLKTEKEKEERDKKNKQKAEQAEFYKGISRAKTNLSNMVSLAAKHKKKIEQQNKLVQKSVGDRIAARLSQDMAQQMATIDTAVDLGQWDEVNKLRENLNDWLGSVDPNSSDYRSVDKDPELEPNTISSILESLRATHSSNDLKFQSKIAVGQSMSEITNNHEAASDIIKNMSSTAARGGDVMSGDFANLVEVHKLAIESPVMQGGSSPVLNKGAAEIRDAQLTDSIDLFVMGQSRSGNIHNTQASIDSLVALLDENKYLYSEDALKYATKNLLNLQKEIGEPDSAAVAALNSKYHEAANMMSNGSTPTSEYSNHLLNLVPQLIDVDEPKARFVHLFSKFGSPEVISEMTSWIRNNRESAPIEYFNDSELLKDLFNKGSFDSGQLNQISSFITKLGEKHAENQSNFGDWGSVLTEQSDLAKSASEHTQQLKQIMSGSDYAEQGAEWLSTTFNQGPIPAGTDRTMFEGAHLINSLLGDDATPEDVIKVSNMFTQFWGVDKMLDFSSYAHQLNNEDLQFVGVLSSAQLHSKSDPTYLADRITLGIQLNSDGSKAKILGNKVEQYNNSMTHIFGDASIFGDTSFAKQTIDASDGGGLRATSLMLQSYVNGIVAQHILSNPYVTPEEVSEHVDKILSQDMTILTDSSGNSQVLWNKVSQHDYVGAPLNYFDWFTKNLTMQEAADVSYYNALNILDEKGIDLVDLLSTFDNPDLDPVTETTLSSLSSESLEKLYEFISPTDIYESLTTGSYEDSKILRLNPMTTTLSGSHVRSLQVYDPENGAYVNLKDKHGNVVSFDEKRLRSLSTNENVEEMNFVKAFDDRKEMLEILTMFGQTPMQPSDFYNTDEAQYQNQLDWQKHNLSSWEKLTTHNNLINEYTRKDKIELYRNLKSKLVKLPSNLKSKLVKLPSKLKANHENSLRSTKEFIENFTNIGSATKKEILRQKE